ncbi:MAG: HsdM family class I SAM-dependent methyltransferase [Methylobacter sp.]
MAILIKYLDDRRDTDGNRVFQTGFFTRFSQSNCDEFAVLFYDRGCCIKLLDYLGEHFNGGIFKLTQEERIELETADLSAIADFLRGDIENTGQQRIWPLYSFEDLPVELISNIYEEFLATSNKADTKGVVYTPPMLVDFLLEQCLPLDPLSLNWRILDPPCGSGIFLVGAFKRLTHCWRMVNDWKTPTYQDLQSILKKNIFGIDKEPEAILVAAFSLCVALCDELEPTVIWNKLKFDDLCECNLQAKDFFEVVQSKNFEGHFDLIVGNPPFDSQLMSKAAMQVEKLGAKNRPALPDHQVALLFLEQSFRLVRVGGMVCLIHPSGPLLYNGNAQAFRQYIFDTFNIDRVFDFTSLEGVLFKAKVATAAVIGRNTPAIDDKLLHLTFRRTKAIKEKLLFELDAYDFHWLSRKAIKQCSYVWKANLLGGGRLHRLLQRLTADMSTLGEYLQKKKQDNGWQFGEGYNIGCGSHLNELPNVEELKIFSPKELKQKYNLPNFPILAPLITGRPCIDPESLTTNGIKPGSITECKDIFFERTRDKIREIFLPPHVLIREVVDHGAIPAVFSNEALVFSKQIFGIHAQQGDEDKLKNLATRLNDSKLFGFFAIAFSGRTLVGRGSSILQDDILALPYSDEWETNLNYWEEALIEDVLEELVEFRRKGEKSHVLQKANDSDLGMFGEMYCRILNLVYKQFRPLPPIRFESFVCYPFCYGERTEIDIPSEDKIAPFLEQLLHQQIGSRLFVNRILRLYEQNVVFIVKPNQKRYWLRSIALRDADETLVDLLEQGY